LNEYLSGDEEDSPPVLIDSSSDEGGDGPREDSSSEEEGEPYPLRTACPVSIVMKSNMKAPTLTSNKKGMKVRFGEAEVLPYSSPYVISRRVVEAFQGAQAKLQAHGYH
jgi:hypothetical protein